MYVGNLIKKKWYLFYNTAVIYINTQMRFGERVYIFKNTANYMLPLVPDDENVINGMREATPLEIAIKRLDYDQIQK